MIKVFVLGCVSVVLLYNKCNQKAVETTGEKENVTVLQQLYAKYKNGEIEECQYNNARVYRAGLNAPDAGSVIYNQDGVKIGSCNYGWGKPDSMCHEMQNCEDVYRVADNIWGKPAVDKYNLSSNDRKADE